MSKSGTPMPKKAKNPEKSKKLKVAFTVVVSALESGRVIVSGHPMNLMAAMSILDAAQVAVVQQFVEYAKNGQLDKDYNLKQSKILQAKSSLVGPDGKRLN